MVVLPGSAFPDRKNFIDAHQQENTSKDQRYPVPGHAENHGRNGTAPKTGQTSQYNLSAKHTGKLIPFFHKRYTLSKMSC